LNRKRNIRGSAEGVDGEPEKPGRDKISLWKELGVGRMAAFTAESERCLQAQEAPLLKAGTSIRITEAAISRNWM
jgi:hypothetical protein